MQNWCIELSGKARLLVVVYTVIGFLLVVVGGIVAYLANTGSLPEFLPREFGPVLAIGIGIILFLLGLHWVVVGIASVRKK